MFVIKFAVKKKVSGFLKGEKSFVIKATTGESFEYMMPSPGQNESFIAFAPPKSGSTLLYKLLSDVCVASGVVVIDLPTASFKNGIRPVDLTESIAPVFVPYGYAYLGWRHYPQQVKNNLQAMKIILLVRDPRDMLVSLYYSKAFSHPAPKHGSARDLLLKDRELAQEADINKWVCKHTSQYKKVFESYLTNLSSDKTQVYRYEDVIFRKQEWLADMLVYLNIDLPRKSIAAIADRHDIRPEKENPGAHVRQVSPGNYLNKLQPDTIEFLNNELGEILKRFGYVDPVEENGIICFAPQGQISRSILI